MKHEKITSARLACPLYYLMVPAVYAMGIGLLSLPIRGSHDIGGAVVAMLITIYVYTPVVSAILMRLSPRRCLVDVPAALEIPAVLYAFTVLPEIIAGENAGQVLLAGLSESWMWLLAILAFCMICSVSPARRAGENRVQRLLAKHLD